MILLCSAVALPWREPKASVIDDLSNSFNKVRLVYYYRKSSLFSLLRLMAGVQGLMAGLVS
jgi:hypothetical protein